jgi:hypothetical protein
MGRAVDAAAVAPPGDDPMWEVLQQFDHADPQLRLIARLLHAQTQRTQAPAAPRRPTADELERSLGRLRHAYVELREQYRRLAAALGACARCWGDDPRCRECGGAGTSGFFDPDPELFEWYVVPAVRRVRTRRPAPSRSRAPQARQANAQPAG